MNDKFYSLGKDKQDRMINGAMQIFALNGYRHASTDEMVKLTGVSKGLWFHYFDNKKGLYYYVCAYGVRYSLMEIAMKINNAERDYFELRRQVEAARADLALQYPYLPILIISLMEETDEEAAQTISNIKIQYQEKMDQIYSRANRIAFDTKEELRIINTMLDSTFDRMLREHLRLNMFSKDRYMREVDKFLAIAKRMIQ